MERTAYILEVKDVSKSFGGTKALSRVSLQVSRGELVGIIGPNGSGKTTLFNVITGVFPSDRGTVLYNGEDISGLKSHRICKMGLARTFQVVQPFGNLSVFDTVVVGALNRRSMQEAKETVLPILEQVGLKEKAKAKRSEMTGADLKALELAKALATGANAILLDEVMAGLTPSETHRMIGIVRELRRNGITFVLVEHVMAVIMELAERLIVLNFGEKIAEGTPKEIVDDPRVIECYLGRRR